LPIWCDIKPSRLGRGHRDHPWVFVQHIETPSERGDGEWRDTLLFRNRERTIFGAREYRDLHHPRFEDVAARVVQDPAFRKSLVSDDPELPKLWKRR